MLGSAKGCSTVDTRVGGQSVTPSSMQSVSDCSTITEWMDVADTRKYKPQYICEFCNTEFSRPTDLTKHVKYNCLQNSESKCNNSLLHKFVCKKCGRRYKIQKALTYHEKHECQQFTVCLLCNHKFAGTVIPQRHIARCQKKQQGLSKRLIDAVFSENDGDRYSQMICNTSDDNSD